MRLKYIFLNLIFLIQGQANADTVQGRVATMWVNQKVWFQLDSMPPRNELEVTCNVTRRYVVDATTDKGKAIYSAILTAKASGLTIRVVGSGNCNFHSDSEGVSYIQTL